MAKSVHNDVLDAALDNIADNGDEIYVCSTEPTNYTEASSTYALADTTGLTTGDGNGVYTIADGDTSGRKLTIAAQSGITVDTGGSAQHIAICDNANTKLLYVTTTAATTITASNNVDLSAWDIEIADPS